MTHLTAISVARLGSGKTTRAWWDGIPVLKAACGAQASPESLRVVSPDFSLTPEKMPTCPRCAVLLDQALETQRVHAGVGTRKAST